MAQLTPKVRRRGLEFAEEIALLAAKAFDAQTKRELYAVVHSVRKRYGFSEEEKSREILRRVHIGASSVDEIARETGLNPQDVNRITSLLLKRNIIRSQSVGHGGPGRPMLLFFPVEDQN